MKWVVRITALCVVFLGLPILALAQEATILGTVTDPSGAAVPSVAITITNTDTTVATHTTTNDVGQYVVPLLHIGHYTVQAQAPNFKLAEQKGIVLEVNDRRRVDFQLEMGASNVTVTVEATPIAVETDSNEISTVVTGNQITQLDTDGRSLYELVNQVPGVTSNQADFQTPTPMGGDQTLSFNGQRIAHALYMVDGGEAADRGGSGAIVMPSLDALSEFRVLTSNYSAEYGLVSGATITTVVKSGTDQVHASAWWYGRDKSLDGTNYFNPGASAGLAHFNLYGFNVGGPISTFIGKVHPDNPKTFFFYNMEWRRELSSNVFNNQAEPYASSFGGNLAAMVAFDVKQGASGGNYPLLNYGFLGPTGDAGAPQAPFCQNLSTTEVAAFKAAGVALSSTGTGTANCAAGAAAVVPLAYNGTNNVINPALIDPNAAAMLKAGIFPTIPDSTTSDGFFGSANAPTSVLEELGRVDHTFNSKVSIFGHWISEQVSQTDIPTRWAWSNGPTAGDTFGNPSYSAVAHLTHTISPTLLNEIAFNYDGNRINMLPAVVYSDAATTGFTENTNKLFGFQNGTLPAIILTRTGSVFNNNWNPWINSADDYQIRDDISWTKGGHQFKMGGSWANFRKAQPLQDSPQGQFQFGGGQFTQYDFADFLLGLSSSYSEAVLEDTRHWNSVSWVLYLEDDWRASRRLTLNLGVRWDGIPHTAEINGQMANFYPNLWNAVGAAQSFGEPLLGISGNGTGWAGSPGGQICTAAQSTVNGVTLNAGCTGANPFLGVTVNKLANGLLAYDNGLGIPGITPGVNNGLVPNYWGTVAPRIGLAFDLTGQGKTIVRAGYGWFFERLQGNDMYQVGGDNLFGGSAGLSNVSLSNPHNGVDQFSQVYTAAQLPVFALNQQGFLNGADYKIPTSYQYSASIEQQLGKRSVLTIAYVGNEGHHESYRTEPNLVPQSILLEPACGGTITTNCVPATPGALFKEQNGVGVYNGNSIMNQYLTYLGFGSMNTEQNDADSHYNSLQASLRAQLHGLQMQAGYTYSRAIDSTTGANGDGGDLDQTTNPYLGWRYDVGLSQLDRTHVAFVNFVYDLPFWRNSSSRLVKDTIAGWQISGVVTMESGLPLNLGTSEANVCSAVPNGNCSVRPNITGAVTYPHAATTLTSGLTSVQWFNTTPFSNNNTVAGLGVASWGNLPFDALRGPGRDNWNMALRKTFAAGERLHFEAGFETFNTFNHTQFNNSVDTGLGDANFGKVTGAWDPREVQIEVKAIF
jgi:hypothetical protein